MGINPAVKFPDARILVFCKAPVPGQVKTRLAKDIGDTAATLLHESLAHRCLQNLTDAGVAAVQLWCAPDVEHPFFQQCNVLYGVELHAQVGDDLGERMLHAVEHALSEASQCVLVGTDCPAMDGAIVNEALMAMNTGADSVISPAEDGGYVLLGLSKTMPELFHEISWGTQYVLAQTRSRRQGRWRELATLWDVDRLDDVRRLRDTAEEWRLENRLVTLLKAMDCGAG